MSVPKVTVEAREGGGDWDRWGSRGAEMWEGKEVSAPFLSCKGWGLFKMKTASDSRLAKFGRVQLEKADLVF